MTHNECIERQGLVEQIGELNLQLAESKRRETELQERIDSVGVWDDCTTLENRVKTLEDALESVQNKLTRVYLTCSCVNWMGGCKREYTCSYGKVEDSKRLIKQVIAAKEPKA